VNVNVFECEPAQLRNNRLSVTVADLPSYNRPNFPTPSGNTSGTNGGGSTLGYTRGSKKGAGSPHSPGQSEGPEGANIRPNPLAAFDTRDVSVSQLNAILA